MYCPKACVNDPLTTSCALPFYAKAIAKASAAGGSSASATAQALASAISQGGGVSNAVAQAVAQAYGSSVSIHTTINCSSFSLLTCTITQDRVGYFSLLVSII